MTIGVLPNPLGAGYFDAAPSIGNYHQTVKVDTASAALPIGTVVELEGYAGPGTGNPPTVPVVQASATTADNLLLGVVTQASVITSAAKTVGAGTGAVVCVMGICQVLCDATTAVGDALIQSAATAGAAKSGTHVIGQTIGVALQAVTISSGTALVWAYVRIV